MTKSNAFGGEKQNKNSNGEQSDLCDLEQVISKQQLQAESLPLPLDLTAHSVPQLAMRYHPETRLLGEAYSADLLIRLSPRGVGEINFLLNFRLFNELFGCSVV